MRARAVDAVSIVVLLETQIRRLVYAYTADERLALVIARLDVEPRLASRVRVSPARCVDCSSSSAIVLLIDIVVDDGYLFHVFSPLRCSPRAPNNRCLA